MDFERLVALRDVARARGGASFAPKADDCVACVAGEPHWPACSCGNRLTIADRGGVCRQCVLSKRS